MLRLHLDTQYFGDVVVVYCRGRIVYRDEAAALRGVVGSILSRDKKVVLDLRDVICVDCAGLGELLTLHNKARSRDADVKFAGANPFVTRMLDVTKVNGVLNIHPNVDDALIAFSSTTFQPNEACVVC